MNRSRSEWLIFTAAKFANHRDITHHPSLKSVDSQGGVISAAHLQLVLSQHYLGIFHKP